MRVSSLRNNSFLSSRFATALLVFTSPVQCFSSSNSKLGLFLSPSHRTASSFRSTAFLEQRGFTRLHSAATSTGESPSVAIETDTMTASSKLEALRANMKDINVDVYLVPSDDPHLSGTSL